MDINTFPVGELQMVFRALRTALKPDPLPIAAGEVRVEGAHRRKRRVQRNYLPLMPLALDQARQQCGLLPKLQAYLPGLAVEEDIAGRNGVAFRSFRRVFSSGDPQDPRGTCCG